MTDRTTRIGTPVRLTNSNSADELSWVARVISDENEEIGALWDGREDRFAIVPKAKITAADALAERLEKASRREHRRVHVKDWEGCTGIHCMADRAALSAYRATGEKK